MKCGGRIISEYDENLPKDLTVEDILTYSSNIGSVKIGEIIGKDKMIKFLNKIGVLEKMKFDIEEIGTPIPFRWRDCKLKTVSYGHGITTTPIQLAKGYSILTNGGYQITPTLIAQVSKFTRIILDKNISPLINQILRKLPLWY